jgi:hypothetical protein
MRKLLKNIFSYSLRTGQIFHNPSLLNERKEKVFVSTTTGTSRGGPAGLAFIFYKGDHTVLVTSGASKHAL